MKKHNKETLEQDEMDKYFDMLIDLIGNKKIIFITHFNVDLVKNRSIIVKNLIKNITKRKNKNITIKTPNQITGLKVIDKILSDFNHYDTQYHEFVASKFIRLFDEILLCQCPGFSQTPLKTQDKTPTNNPIQTPLGINP